MEKYQNKKNRIQKFSFIIGLIIIVLCFFISDVHAAAPEYADLQIYNSSNNQQTFPCEPTFSVSTYEYTLYLDLPQQISFMANLPSDWALKMYGEEYASGEMSSSFYITEERDIAFAFRKSRDITSNYIIHIRDKNTNNTPPVIETPQITTKAPLLTGLNASINDINIPLDINFDSSVKNYKLSYTTAPSQGEMISLYMQGTDTTEIKINNTVINGNQGNIYLPWGSVYTITLYNNSFSTTYQLDTSYETSALSDMPKLSSLVLSGTSASFTPVFDPETANYIAEIEAGITSVTISASASNGATIMIDGSNTTAKNISISSENTYIPISVSKNGLTSYYSIQLKQAKAVSTNQLSLSMLKIMTDNDVINILETENEGVFRVSLPNNIKNIKFAAAADGNISISIGGKSIYNGGAWSSAYTLSTSGETVYVMTLTDKENKVSKNYNIIIDKAEQQKIVLTLGSKEASVNGTIKTMDVAPFTVSGRTMVPVRFISEFLGATVIWTESTKSALIADNGISLTLTLGKKMAGMDVAPLLQNGRIFVPLRFVSEKLGANVDWIAETKQIIITR